MVNIQIRWQCNVFARNTLLFNCKLIYFCVAASQIAMHICCHLMNTKLLSAECFAFIYFVRWKTVVARLLSLYWSNKKRHYFQYNSQMKWFKTQKMIIIVFFLSAFWKCRFLKANATPLHMFITLMLFQLCSSIFWITEQPNFWWVALGLLRVGSTGSAALQPDSTTSLSLLCSHGTVWF